MCMTESRLLLLRRRLGMCLLPALFWGGLTTAARAQDHLATMPGYDRYQRMNREIRDAARAGFPDYLSFVTWAADGSAFQYRKDGKLWRYDVAARKAAETDKELPSQPT